MTTATETIVDQTFALTGSGTLELHTVSGRIRVRAGEDGSIVLHAVLVGSQHAIENTEIEYGQVGDRVTVRTVQRRHGLVDKVLHGGSLASVEYDMLVPRGCALELHSVSADIDAEGVGGEAALHSVSGEVNLVDAQGHADLHTVSGTIDAARVAGTLRANSTSGSVVVRDARLDSFRLHTVSGSMNVDTPLLPERTYDASTVSGSLTLTVPAGTTVKARLHSVSGTIRSDLPGTASHGPARHEWSSEGGDGAARLSMDSVSGSLTLRAGQEG
jgi:DUF4097 and DUF4098 domain-containing protein YvlB